MILRRHEGTAVPHDMTLNRIRYFLVERRKEIQLKHFELTAASNRMKAIACHQQSVIIIDLIVFFWEINNFINLRGATIWTAIDANNKNAFKQNAKSSKKKMYLQNQCKNNNNYMQLIKTINNSHARQ